jgi:transketolase
VWTVCFHVDSFSYFYCHTQNPFNFPLPVEMVGVNDSFGESGTPEELMEKYGLNAAAIVNAALKAISRK